MSLRNSYIDVHVHVVHVIAHQQVSLRQEPAVRQRSHYQSQAGYTSNLQPDIDFWVDQSTAARARRQRRVEGEGQLKSQRFTDYDP